MISRRYVCLNTHCRQEFDSFDLSPRCPLCSNIRIKELPPRVNIKTSRVKEGDRIAKDLANAYGLTNFKVERDQPNVITAAPQGEQVEMRLNTAAGAMTIPMAADPSKASSVGTWGKYPVQAGVKVQVGKGK